MFKILGLKQNFQQHSNSPTTAVTIPMSWVIAVMTASDTSSPIAFLLHFCSNGHNCSLIRLSLIHFHPRYFPITARHVVHMCVVADNWGEIHFPWPVFSATEIVTGFLEKTQVVKFLGDRTMQYFETVHLFQLQ